MTQYQSKTFTVPVGTRPKNDCKHGWWTTGTPIPLCVFCGDPKPQECTACHCNEMKHPHYHSDDEFGRRITQREKQYLYDRFGNEP